MGVMKMGNTVPRVGFEPTPLAFWASVLPLHQVGSLTPQLYPYTAGEMDCSTAKCYSRDQDSYP